MKRTKVRPIKTIKKKSKNKKLHPWRICPEDQHWGVTHPLHIPPSKKSPAGSITTRHGHCAHNPSGKDQLYPAEIKEIAKRNFSKVKNKPCGLNLDFGSKGSKYDDLIAGWVQYWNDVLKPDEPLSPNLFKALVASESRFIPNILANKKNQNSARGLTQITNETRKILGDEKGELKDHLLPLTREDLNDPNINICAGIRWLFHKRKLASSKLGRTATWEEAVAEYKRLTKDLQQRKPRAKELMGRFEGYWEKYNKCEK